MLQDRLKWSSLCVFVLFPPETPKLLIYLLLTIIIALVRIVYYMGPCCSFEVKKEYKINTTEVPDVHRSSMLRYQRVLLWKKKNYDELEKNNPFVKYWYAQRIAKHKYLVSLVVQHAMQQIDQKNKVWSESQLNQQLLIRQNRLQVDAQFNKMVDQNCAYLQKQKFDKIIEEQLVNGNHRNNRQKFAYGVVQAGKGVVTAAVKAAA